MNVNDGTDAQLYIEQPDGLWRSIPAELLSTTPPTDDEIERHLTPLDQRVEFTVDYELPVRFISPRDPRDFLVSVYEFVLQKKCPGSWSTKRLEKKRLKALSLYFSA